MRYFLPFSLPFGDLIEVSMLLPGRSPIEVVLRIDRMLSIEVAVPLSPRPLLVGAVNLGSVSWLDLPEKETDWVVCRTALEMLDARVVATCRLFRGGYLDSNWLTARARYEVA